jgi:KUP system potassium uptake protein
MAQEGLSGSAANVSEPGKGEGDHHSHGGIWSLTLGSIGVVYGDIGTSPLYALRESLAHTHAAGAFVAQDVIGIVSLLLWALFLTVTVKYVLFLMRADN